MPATGDCFLVKPQTPGRQVQWDRVETRAPLVCLSVAVVWGGNEPNVQSEDALTEFARAERMIQSRGRRACSVSPITPAACGDLMRHTCYQLSL